MTSVMQVQNKMNVPPDRTKSHQVPTDYSVITSIFMIFTMDLKKMG